MDSIEELTRQRKSGFALPDDLSELEKELLMVWDETVEDFERALRLRTMMALEVLIQAGGVR